MSDARVHLLPVDDVALRVYDTGPIDAPCVVLTHSIMTDAAMWEPQVQFLVEGGYRVLRPESRGHGGSSISTAPLTIDRLAQDVIAVLDSLRVRTAHYVGLSLGGMVGFALGQRHRERVGALVICDARADSPPAFANPWNERIEQANELGMASLVQPTLDRWFGDRLGVLDPAVAQNISKAIASTSVQGFVATARALQSFDFTGALALMRPGSTLIVGENDGVLPAVMTEIARLMPDCALEGIPGAGHLPNVENPELFNAVLGGALAKAR